MSEATKSGGNPVDVHMTIRDWSQSSHGTRVSAEHMIETMRHIGEYGIGAAQLGGGTFGQLLIRDDREPYDFVGQLANHANAETGPENRIAVTALFRNEVGLSISRQAPDVLEHIIRRHAEIGVNRLDNFHHTNDSQMMRAIPHICKKLQDEGYDIHAQAGIAIQSNPDSIANKAAIIDEILFEAEKMIESGHVGFYVKNASGVLYPDLAHDVVAALRDRFEQPIGFHTHNTYGYGYQTTLAVIEAGADSVDALPFALSEGTAQISVEKLMFLMAQNGMHDRMPNVNIDAIGKDEAAAFAVRGQYSGLELKFDRELFEAAEIATAAGGALTSLMNIYGANLRQSMPGMDDQEILMRVLQERAKTREAFGYVTSVTPVEDMQNAQAAGDLFIQTSKGEEGSFLALPVPTSRFLTGGLGKVPAGVDPDVQKRVLDVAGLEEVLPVTPFEDMEPGMPALKQKLTDAGIDSPTDDEATFLAMNAGGAADFIKRMRAGELAPTVPQFPRILDTGGALEPYKGDLFQIAYGALDLHKIEIGHYEGADYSALHEKGRIIDVDDEAIAALDGRFEKVDFHYYAAKYRQIIEENVKALEQRLLNDDSDRALALSAQRVITKLSSDIGVPIAEVPHMDLDQFPKAESGKMAKKDETWPSFVAEIFQEERDAASRDSGFVAAWEGARILDGPPELGVVTQDGEIEPAHPHHEEEPDDDDALLEAADAGDAAEIEQPTNPQV